jgi:hypothetical protein
MGLPLQVTHLLQPAALVADRHQINPTRCRYSVRLAQPTRTTKRWNRAERARGEQSTVARTPRVCRGITIRRPRDPSGRAYKKTGPNGRAVGPEIHAEARTNALGRSRTFNLQIKSLLLCQLSYECKILKRRRLTWLVVRPKRLTPTARHPPAEQARRTSTSGAPGGTRTPDPQLRRLSLYPAELLAQRPNRRSVPPSATSRGARI